MRVCASSMRTLWLKTPKRARKAHIGWWARLFGGAAARAEAAPDIPHAKPVRGSEPIWQRLLQEPGVTVATSQILLTYSTALETVCEGYHGQGRRLYPESVLPFPKETIRAALALSFIQLERQGWPRTGIAPGEVLAAAKALDLHFTPAAEIPAHPIDNWLAFTRRLRTLSATQQGLVSPWMVVLAVGWEGLLVRAGVPKGRRDALVNALQEATWPLSSEQVEGGHTPPTDVFADGLRA
jgi:hypothetical protein